MNSVAILVSVLIGAIGASMVWLLLTKIFQRIAALEARQAEMDKIPTRSHYSYNQVAALHDAIAVILSAKSDNDAERARMDTALSILATLYKNPQSYDPERANNRKE